ncbi:hypothetical protein [Herbidospora daliensis]|uniref:hypothetical protein n=1 Tax=Herbidospora daliensis TaxID=295585 RepID=UPI0007812C30|nr:hypothetical protein [Herbidospora daliensis]
MRQGLPPRAYQTFGIAAPADRLVKAACPQVGCVAWRKGWESVIDEKTALGASQAAWIRTYSARTFRESRAAGLTVFRFEPGQRCFADHHTRPEIYFVRPGDLTTALGQPRRHSRPADWVEDFGLNQQRLRDAQARG